MHLVAGDHRLAVAQAGPDFLILESPAELPPTRAELVVEIDGHEKRRSIYLPEGIRSKASRTRITAG